MKTITTILGGMILCAWSGLLAWAAPPYVNYQGQLKNISGQALPTGNYTMEFNIYDQAQLGTKVWGPFLFDGDSVVGHGPLVPVANGRFNVIIGPQDTNGASISAVFGEDDRFMEIKVNGGEAILPRQRFLSTAYAFQAVNAVQAANAENAQKLNDKDPVAYFLPPGMIVPFAGPVGNIPQGWLLCDGAPLATSGTYSQLYAAIGYAWGGAGATFKVPDLRGMFLRGVNNGRSDDYRDLEAADRVQSPNGGNSGTNVGSFQTNRVSVHSHRWAYVPDHPEPAYRFLNSWIGDSVTNAALLGRLDAGGAGGLAERDDMLCVATAANDKSVYTDPASMLHQSGETRPNNAYVNYIIKY